METESGSHQESGSSSEGSGTDSSGITRGAWMGSNVTKYEIDWLYRSRRIPEGVACRLPRDEIIPVPEPGERVVFLAHFERGFGLPVSDFFRRFLDFYELQPHHLPGNAVFYLSYYATFMEAYIGIRPTPPPAQNERDVRSGDPTKITGIPLSKSDIVLKAKQICQTAMPEDWEWGLRPLSSTNPPTQEAKDRFPGIESDRRGPCRKRGLDKFDPDPVIHWRDLKMGRTPAARLGKSPPEPADLPSANINPQVHEHVTRCRPRLARVPGQTHRWEQEEEGTGDAGSANRLLPNASRQSFGGKQVGTRRYKGKQMPTSSGPTLKLGPRPEDREDLNSSSSLKSGTRVPATSLPPLRGAQSSGRAAPKSPDHRARRISPPPETQDTAPATSAPRKKLPGGRNLRFLPSKEKRRRRVHALPPPRAVPETSVPATSTSAPEAPPPEHTGATPTPPPKTSVPKATGATPTPLPSQGPPAATPKPPPAAPKVVQFLKPGASRGKAVDGSVQWLAVSSAACRACAAAADVRATRGVGKDRLPIVDPAGPKCTEGHFIRLKRAVREFDNAWHDATSNVVLFEELLWEHRDLSEAHSKCQAIPEASIEALKVQVAALQEEKDKLVVKHREELSAQKASYQELKDQLIQLGLDHATALKATESAAEARLNEALEDATNANVVLQAELEEATKALKTAEARPPRCTKPLRRRPPWLGKQPRTRSRG
ncbi:hypothetical protein QYE76_025103 [Lolium multiflorum]|uniref:Transposase (putative) gypsy type domain-containing protein n=1 Tax=Lolium multiflorum TaxID=4521 RepID=A0AAD8RF52_LOLMU|nr:hypothetical protein QYE76_025103 [Lolium multiflorum]